MVTKVGSAGLSLDSVIQYTQNDSKQESKADTSAEKQSAVAGRVAAPVTKVKQGNQSVNNATAVENVDEEMLGNHANLELSEEAIKITVDDVNKKINPLGATIEFSFHERTKRYSFKVVDNETGDVIREVPPKESLDMVAKMFEMAGLIVDEKL